MLTFVAPIIFTVKKRTGWAIFSWILFALYLVIVLLCVFAAAVENMVNELYGAFHWWNGWVIFLISLIVPKKKPEEIIVNNTYYAPEDTSVSAPDISADRSFPSGSTAAENPRQKPSAAVVSPPPIPQLTYHAVIGDRAEGPFSMTALSKMIQNGHIDGSTLVWKQGFDEWKKAAEVDELKPLFAKASAPASQD